MIQINFFLTAWISYVQNSTGEFTWPNGDVDLTVMNQGPSMNCSIMVVNEDLTYFASAEDCTSVHPGKCINKYETNPVSVNVAPT